MANRQVYLVQHKADDMWFFYVEADSPSLAAVAALDELGYYISAEPVEPVEETDEATA